MTRSVKRGCGRTRGHGGVLCVDEFDDDVHVEAVGNVAMAKAGGMSQTTVTRIWRTIGLKPLVDSFKLSSDPLFVDKVRDIVECT
jgi:hypothetical protein